jgi:hypothetical protein
MIFVRFRTLRVYGLKSSQRFPRSSRAHFPFFEPRTKHKNGKVGLGRDLRMHSRSFHWLCYLRNDILALLTLAVLYTACLLGQVMRGNLSICLLTMLMCSSQFIN